VGGIYTDILCIGEGRQIGRAGRVVGQFHHYVALQSLRTVALAFALPAICPTYLPYIDHF